MKDSVENPDSGANNTVILFISDHGYRFGDFRETFLGFYEESLPFFFIRIPQVLKELFPHWYLNLNENSRLLTTPLDLHETLKDILNLSTYNATNLSSIRSDKTLANDSSNSSNSKVDWDYPIRSSEFRERYSFFEKAPTNRTCESSRIPQRYCMCGVSPETGRKSERSTHLAKFVVSELNTKVLGTVIEKKECETLSFSKVLYGRESGNGEVWNNFGALVKYQDYIVALETKPGEGHFEGRVRIFQNGTEVLTDSVSRINSYKGQSECMSDYTLKNYCMCRKLPNKAKKKG